MKAGKVWGQTELIHANGVLEFHRIEYKAGYKCLNTYTSSNGMDFMLSLVKCLSEFGRKITTYVMKQY